MHPPLFRWMPTLWDLPQCTAFKDTPFGVFHASQSWHWFFLQQQMIKEAFIGIAISLSFALVVLILFIGKPKGRRGLPGRERGC